MVHETSRPVCLITGGSQGVGLATALRFAKGGFDIVFCGRDASRLSQASEAIANLGANCLPIEFDLDASAGSAAQLAEQAWERFGRIDVLVNNAAMAPLNEFESIAAATFESVLNVNFRAVFYLTQAVWSKMKISTGDHVIINISSLAAVDPFPGFSVYGSSKAWLDLMTVALAAEGKSQGIRVYSIRPGAVETSLLRSLFPDFPAEQTVSPQQVAEMAWELTQPERASDSGKAFAVTNQAESVN